MWMKKVAIVGLVAVTLFVTGCGCSKDKNNDKKTTKEPETVVNTAEDVIKDQEFEGLKMTNTSLVVEGGISTLITEVSNNTGSDYYLNQFKITVKDKDGNVITTLSGYVGAVIPNGKVRVINTSSDLDLSNADSIEYSVIK